MIDIGYNQHVYPNRQKDSFAYSCEVSKPQGIIDDILDWAKKELNFEWRWNLVSTSTDRMPGKYIFYFDNERDYLAFIMKWR